MFRGVVARRIELISLFLLLVVVGLRPLIGESHNSAGSPFSAALGDLADPSPLRTLLIDAAILSALGGWLLARAIRPRWRYRWTGIEIGAVLVAVAGAASCFTAGNKRLAINATVDWLTLPLLSITIAQLVRRPWQVRLVLCVVLATAAAQAAECFHQILYTFEESAQDYFANKTELWARQGVALDSPQVELLERRLAAREASGYMWHSNVAGAYLILTVFAAMGLAVGKSRGPAARFRKGFALCTAGVGAGLLVATAFTHSLGAMAAGCIGAVLAIAVGTLKNTIARHRRFFLVAGWVCALGALVAVTGSGLCRGSLPGNSLNFRWQYWTASAGMVADHAMTGVGMENFGRHYLQYKSISSPEEVSNPHNFLVSAATDWGLIGLAGIVVMLVGGSIVLARAPTTITAAERVARTPMADPPGRPFVWMMLLGGAVFAPRIFLLGSDNPHYVIWSTAFPLIVWLLSFAVLALESDSFSHFRSEPLPGLHLVLNCGLIALVISDLVNFALLVPPVAATFFALLGVAVAARSAPQEATRRVLATGRWAPPATTAVALVALGLGVIGPVAGARSHLMQARADAGIVPTLPLESQRAYEHYVRAATADPLDPTPSSECSRWLVGYAEVAGGLRDAFTRAVGRIDQAIRRDPHSIALRRHKRRLGGLLADVSGEPGDYRLAVVAAEQVVRLYPESPNDRVALGECLLRAGQARDDHSALTRAIGEFEHALRLDDDRPEWEKIRRFSDAKRDEVKQRIAAARRLLESRSP